MADLDLIPEAEGPPVTQLPSGSGDTLGLSEVLRERDGVCLGKDGAAAFLGASEGRRYDVGRVVARGGMGAILTARDLNIRRRVAMKVSLDRRPESDAVVRFVEEAQITGQLEHPNIVPVYELGVDADRSVYYTMKFLEGRTLQDILQRLSAGDPVTVSRYPLMHLLTIFQKVAHALAFAHSRGVIHRDLKPENIMIGDFGEVLVMDWGLAKILGRQQAGSRPAAPEPQAVRVEGVRDSDAGSAVHTMQGAVLGTPRYMAPEQAYGRIDQLDARTDIYALGAILYELLTLHPPIEADNVQQLLLKVAAGEIANPLTWSAERQPAVRLPHVPEGRIPRSLAAVAMKALETDPAARYQHVQALQADIEAYQGGFATSAEGAGLLRLVVLGLRRHRREASLIGVALAVILVLAAVFVARLSRERRAAMAAEARAVAVSVRAAPSFRANAAKAMQAERWDTASEALQMAVDLDPEGAAASWHELGRVRLARADYAGAMQAFVQAAEAPHTAARARAYMDALGQLPREPDTHALSRLAEALKAQQDFLVAGAVFRGVRQSGEAAKAELDRMLEAERPGFGDGAVAFTWREDNLLALSIQKSRNLRHLEPFRTAPAEWVRLIDLPNCRDLSALATLPLKRVELMEMPTTDLGFCEGLPIEWLQALRTPIKSLAPVCQAALCNVDIGASDVSSLEPLRGCQLTRLLIGNTAVTDLGPLAGMPLRELDMSYTKVSSVAPLAGAPLEHLNAMMTEVADLTPLAGMPLRSLNLWRCPVRDLRPLAGMPIETLSLARCTNVRDLDVLRSLPLKDLHVGGVGPPEGISFEPLRGLALDRLVLENCFRWHDFTIIEGMPLKSFYVVGDSFRDLRVLRGKPLTELKVIGTPVRDLSPLAGTRLQKLSLQNSKRVEDISVLAGMPLTAVDIRGTCVRDLGPLHECPLFDFWFDVEDFAATDLAWLRAKVLDKINGKKAQRFWVEFDARAQ